MLSTATAVLDWFGVIVFTITGALVASRKQMDVVGFALLGTVTGIGGGTLRDILLGELPVFWVREPAYLVKCVLVSRLVFFTAHIPQSRYSSGDDQSTPPWILGGFTQPRSLSGPPRRFLKRPT
jgi:uncharacterized membrane protein YeiH